MVQAAVGTGVEDVREVRQRLVSIESGLVKTQRQEDKRGVELVHKLSEQEVPQLACHPPFVIHQDMQDSWLTGRHLCVVQLCITPEWALHLAMPTGVARHACLGSMLCPKS